MKTARKTFVTLTTRVVNGFTLTHGSCRCGQVIEIFVPEGKEFICCDCRDEESRKREGWTPANSRD